MTYVERNLECKSCKRPVGVGDMVMIPEGGTLKITDTLVFCCESCKEDYEYNNGIEIEGEWVVVNRSDMIIEY